VSSYAEQTYAFSFEDGGEEIERKSWQDTETRRAMSLAISHGQLLAYDAGRSIVISYVGPDTGALRRFVTVYP
jgi:hypothetical protein